MSIRRLLYFVLILVFGLSSTNVRAKDKIVYVESDADSASISLSLKSDLGIDFYPTRVLVDCSCVEPFLRSSKESQQPVLDFTVLWRGRLIVPVLFAFFDEGKEPRNTKSVWLVRGVHKRVQE